MEILLLDPPCQAEQVAAVTRRIWRKVVLSLWGKKVQAGINAGAGVGPMQTPSSSCPCPACSLAAGKLMLRTGTAAEAALHHLGGDNESFLLLEWSRGKDAQKGDAGH